MMFEVAFYIVLVAAAILMIVGELGYWQRRGFGVASRVWCMCIYLCTCAGIYLLSAHQMWANDEIFYRLNYATKMPVNDFCDIIQSMNAHYFEVNGRYVAHTLVQMFVCLLGINAFAIANALATMALIMGLERLAVKHLSLSALLTVVLLMLAIVDMEYVPCIQISYVWSAAIIVWFLVLYFRHDEQCPRWWQLALLGVYSVIAGGMHDALVIGIGGALGIEAIINRLRLSARQWVMLVCMAVGAVVEICAPCNFTRAGALSIPLFYTLANIAINLRAFYLLIVILVYKLVTKRVTLKNFVSDNRMYLWVVLIYFAFNIMIGTYGRRQFFCVELVSLIMIVQLLKNNTFNIRGLVAIALIVAVMYTVKVCLIGEQCRAYDELVENVRRQPQGVIYQDFPKPNRFLTPVYYIYQERANGTAHDAWLDINGAEKEDTLHRVVLPTALRNLETDNVDHYVLEYQPGRFVIARRKGSDTQFTLHRRLDFGLFSMPYSDYHVEFDTESPYNTESYDIMFFTDPLPIVRNLSVDTANP